MLCGKGPVPKDQAVSKRMKGNKNRDTKPELELRKRLWEEKIRGYRLYYKEVEGKPDLAFTKKRVAVFLHGCFWHLCPYCKLKIPTNNHEFWRDKLMKNKMRDKIVSEKLQHLDWKVVVIWECQLKNEPTKQVDRIKMMLSE